MGQIKYKKAQEEIVGFALIIIISAIILLIFLGLYINKPPKETVESYEVENFIQVAMDYTSDCEKGTGIYLSIGELIPECYNNAECSNGKNSCNVLKNTLKKMLEESWKIGEEWPNKGYELNISYRGDEILNIKEGEVTSNKKGATELSKFDIYFTIYY